jgi:hypothetical protein
MKHVIILVALVAAAAFVSGCTEESAVVDQSRVVTDTGGSNSNQDVDLDAFREMARQSDCDDTRNQLFLIDEEVVFWAREGQCADWMYTYRLFGNAPDVTHCRFEDSIAGPQSECSKEHEALFSVIMRNLDDPTLGLAAERVQVIKF